MGSGFPTGLLLSLALVIPTEQFNGDFNANELVRRQSSPGAAPECQELASKEQSKAVTELCHHSAPEERSGAYRAQVTATPGGWGDTWDSPKALFGVFGSKGSQSLVAAGQEKVESPAAPGRWCHPSASKSRWGQIRGILEIPISNTCPGASQSSSKLFPAAPELRIMRAKFAASALWEFKFSLAMPCCKILELRQQETPFLLKNGTKLSPLM